LRDKYLGHEFRKYPFSSKRKRMGVFCTNVGNGKPSNTRFHEKGASELVLDACDKIYWWDSGEVI